MTTFLETYDGDCINIKSIIRISPYFQWIAIVTSDGKNHRISGTAWPVIKDRLKDDIRIIPYPELEKVTAE